MNELPEGKPLQAHDVLPMSLTKKDDPITVKGPIDMGYFLHLVRTHKKVTVI